MRMLPPAAASGTLRFRLPTLSSLRTIRPGLAVARIHTPDRLRYRPAVAVRLPYFNPNFSSLRSLLAFHHSRLAPRLMSSSSSSTRKLPECWGHRGVSSAPFPVRPGYCTGMHGARVFGADNMSTRCRPRRRSRRTRSRVSSARYATARRASRAVCDRRAAVQCQSTMLPGADQGPEPVPSVPGPDVHVSLDDVVIMFHDPSAF